MPRELALEIKYWRHEQKISTEAEAMRRLLKAGLDSERRETQRLARPEQAKSAMVKLHRRRISTPGSVHVGDRARLKSGGPIRRFRFSCSRTTSTTSRAAPRSTCSFRLSRDRVAEPEPRSLRVLKWTVVSAASMALARRSKRSRRPSATWRHWRRAASWFSWEKTVRMAAATMARWLGPTWASRFLRTQTPDTSARSRAGPWPRRP